jgi:hypothetical protein
MKRLMLSIVIVVNGLALVAGSALARPLAHPLAHTSVDAGSYTLEVGWVDEPPIVGMKNAVFVSITHKDTDQPVEGVSTLEVTISTGGKDRKLDVRPLSEDAPGQYAADFIPTKRGTYTVKLSGKIETTDVNTSVDIEEVATADSLAFPQAQPSVDDLKASLDALQSDVSSARTFGVAGAALGTIGLVLAGVALSRKRS